jgi:glutamine---fructose-6-phosphate transaminase (isomerizing)
MCGIIGIVSRPPGRPAPTAEEIIGGLDAALARRGDPGAVVAAARVVDEALRGLPGVLALSDRHDLSAAITARLDQLDAYAADVEAALAGAATDESTDDTLDVEALEAASAASIELRDVLWAIRRDRLRTIHEVAQLAGRGAGPAAQAGYLAIQQALSAIDRMEVRGRDSAGIHVFVWDHDLAADDPAVTSALATRSADPLFANGSARLIGRCLSFVYKAAAEIGELGDNTRALRRAIATDRLLRLALAGRDTKVSVLGHTRWASVGIISEPNAHPVNSEEMEQSGGPPPPYVVAVLNGDVDNHADLKVAHGLRFAGPVTTDAKVIPALVSRHATVTGDHLEAFRRTVSSFEGSVAIGMAAADEPQQLLFALHGSGQGIYVGLAEDRYIVASEPYGVVEETDRYLRLDGEHGGQIVALDGRRAGELAGIRRVSYDGSEQPVTDADVVVAEVTTRDIDRGSSPHFLLKEITESPESFAKTLRGKITPGADGQLHAVVGARALPDDVVERLAAGSIRRVRVIGQGTAAVAGQSMAAVLDELTGGALDTDALTATELSGFGLRLDMSDTLAVAISQSGTTTDTNRTVDLLRARGAAVLGIVNRRSSDLTDKADGVLYTSDGRDVEMSVASTKAFYSQVAAGVLLACAITEATGLGSDQRRHELLASLRTVPDAMRAVLARRDVIADAARRFAPAKRYWAVVGNGTNKVAAEEVRIKLSELCYKSIACDVTEDKKHIDLSAEPLILVCAAGLAGSTADDVGKEVAIFRAHKATPIVIADEGDARYPAAAVISVPSVDPALGFVLSAMAGHLFGYEAALAIDSSALPLREAREVIERAVSEETTADSVLARVRREIRRHADEYVDGLRSNRYDGHLEASTAVHLAGLLRSATAEHAVEEYQAESGKVGSPAALVDDLVVALSRAIGELTRPVDAIKHQAKTVTVGISRSDEGVLDRPLVQAVLAAGAGRDVLSYRTLKVLADLDPAVAEVTGFTRYGIAGTAISIVDRGGISRELASRVDRDPSLVGTKRRVANEREVLVARGRRDDRTVIMVPEVKANVTTGITLLHVRFHERLDAATMRAVLIGYDSRYDRLVDWVTETEGSFDDRLLGELSVEELLIEPISDAAEHWRS